MSVNVLKREREKKKLSQAELARLTGVSQSMIAQIERGTKALSCELAKDIANALGIDAAVFVK